MARPIEPTPTLKDKDAERFYESIENAEFDPEKARKIEEARQTYRTLKDKWHSAPTDFTQK